MKSFAYYYLFALALICALSIVSAQQVVNPRATCNGLTGDSCADRQPDMPGPSSTSKCEVDDTCYLMNLTVPGLGPVFVCRWCTAPHGNPQTCTDDPCPHASHSCPNNPMYNGGSGTFTRSPGVCGLSAQDFEHTYSAYPDCHCDVDPNAETITGTYWICGVPT
jgi:hypothetical protein